MTEKISSQSTDHLSAVGREKAIELLHRCMSDHGFLATPQKRDNYSRIWGRDSSIMGLAAVLTRDEELMEGCRRSLVTLAEFQGPHGEIPSNVDPETERISYGGTTGRIDSNLWFLITCGELCRVLQDPSLLEQLLPAVERTRKLLGAWEFNNRGLLYIPPTGDWADEYLQSGYVLYDQLLYYQALRSVCRMHRMHHRTEDHTLREKAVRLKHLIRANYWLNGDDEMPDDVYHRVLYNKGRKALPDQPGKYWLPYFSPLGYGYRFDAMANVLTLLLDIGSPQQDEALIAHIDDNICTDHDALIPAFCPIITPRDERWDDLKMTFSYEFKNEPYEYHNGGLWPMVNGFYAAGLAVSGRIEKAKRILEAVHAANQKSMPDETGDKDEPWSFPEFLNGKTGDPGGVAFMGWSAAGALIADAGVKGGQVFSPEE